MIRRKVQLCGRSWSPEKIAESLGVLFLVAFLLSGISRGSAQVVFDPAFEEYREPQSPESGFYLLKLIEKSENYYANGNKARAIAYLGIAGRALGEERRGTAQRLAFDMAYSEKSDNIIRRLQYFRGVLASDLEKTHTEEALGRSPQWPAFHECLSGAPRVSPEPLLTHVSQLDGISDILERGQELFEPENGIPAEKNTSIAKVVFPKICHSLGIDAKTLSEINLADQEAGKAIPSGNFVRHIRDAIALNKERLPLYSKLTDGASERISSRLLALERASLPFAWFLDRWGRKFQAAGIPILADDFVSMAGVATYSNPPIHCHVASEKVFRKFGALLGEFRRAVRPRLSRKDFSGVAGAAAFFLGKLRALEEEGDCHFALSCHVIESIGLGARNAERYRLASDGKTDSLARAFLEVQLLGLRAFSSLDRPAQDCHVQGVGVLANDLPKIPFP